MERLIILVMTGNKTGRHSLRTEAGTGSKEQDLTLEALMKQDTCSVVTFLKLVIELPTGGESMVVATETVALAESRKLRRVETLSLKKCAN